jgi:hypothetical protein
MAALRRAKDVISRQQQQASALPTGSRVFSNNQNSSAEPDPLHLAHPSLLPKPGYLIQTVPPTRIAFIYNVKFIDDYYDAFVFGYSFEVEQEEY